MASQTRYELEILLGARKASSFDGNINSAKGSLGSISSTAKKAAAAVTAAFAAVNVVDFVEGSMDVYSGFEQSLANTAAIAGATVAEYEQLTDAARAAGRDTSKTAQEAADALGYMALAGWDVEESTSSLMEILKLSEATQLDLARTSDLVTDSMGAMKIPVSELSDYLNLVVQGNNSANMTAEQAMETFIGTGGAANALGVTLTETATAAGILANNGTKGAQAGTALNSIFSRIATNKNAKAAIDALGISLFDAQGEFVGLEKFLSQTNKALGKLSTQDATAYMKEISGTNYYSKFKYLLDAVEGGADGAASSWDSLEKSLENSEGALDTMDAKVMDTVQGSMARMNSALDDMKISLADSFDGEVVEAMELLTGVFNDFSEGIQEFSEEHAVEIHQAFEKVVAGVEMLGSVSGNVIGFVLDHWTLLESVLAGGGVAYGLSNVAGEVLHVANAFKAVEKAQDVTKLTGLAGALGSLTTPMGQITLAAGAAVAGITALKVGLHKMHEQAVEDDLAAHFGNIHLSLEQIDEIAQDIVGKKKLTQISAMLESIGKTDEAIEAMSDSFNKIETLSWKIRAGLNISTDDNDSYVSAVKDYVDEAQNAISSEGYTVSVATKLLFGNNSAQEADVNAFYAGLDSELNELQKKLNKKIEKAVENGVDFNTDKAIQNLLGEINEITSAITEANNNAELEAIKLDYSGKDLDADTFKQLTKDISEHGKTAKEGYKDAFTKRVSYANLKKDRGVMTSEEYDAEVDNAWQGYFQAQAKTLAGEAQFLLDSIEEAYGPDVIEGFQQNLAASLQELKESGVDISSGSVAEVVEKTLANTGLSKTEMDGLVDLFQSGLGDVWSDMESLMTEMQEMEIDIPKSLQESWFDTETLAALSGSAEDAIILMNGVLSDSDERAALLEASKELGVDVPEAWVDGMQAAFPQVKSAAEELKQLAEDSMSGTASIDFQFGVSTSFNSSSGAGMQTEKQSKEKGSGGTGSSKGTKVLSNAQGGIYYSPILTTFAEEGPEAAIPLDGSARGMALLRQVNEMMGLTVVDGLMGDTPMPKVTRDVEMYNRFSPENIANMSSVVLPGAAPEYSIQMTYAPVINVNGDADQQTVEKALKVNQQDLKRMLLECMRDMKRVSFSDGE